MTDGLVADGRVRKEDKDGNDAADIAADFGRLRQPAVVIDARGNLLRVKGERCARTGTLYRFMVAMSRETLRHGGQCGAAMDPMVWDHGIRTQSA